MKLRLQSNSIRLRLKKSEVDLLATTGSVEEKIVFGNGPEAIFRYVLESSRTISAIEATLTKRGVLVQVPAADVTEWACGNEIGMETKLPLGEGKDLHILIEKDFACLNGPAEENVDTFPNPLAGNPC